MDTVVSTADGMHHLARQLQHSRVIAVDFDGVIVDSLDVKAKAICQLLADRPEHVEAAIALHFRHAGLDRRRKLQLVHSDILGETIDDNQLGALVDQFSRLVVDEVVHCPMMEGAIDFLDAFVGRLPIYLVSATPEDELVEILRSRNLDGYFTGVYGYPAEKTQVLTEITHIHSIKPDELTFFGDSAADWTAAEAAGAVFFGISPNGQENPFPSEILSFPNLSMVQRVFEKPGDFQQALSTAGQGL